MKVNRLASAVASPTMADTKGEKFRNGSENY